MISRFQAMSRPVTSALAGVAIVAAVAGLTGCASTGTTATTAACATCPDKFEQDRQAILNMAGEHKVTFDFEEVVALRDGYELSKPYKEHASELVVVVKDTGDHISLQHLLVVSHGDKDHVIKHWRQDWTYQANAGYDFQGDNVWAPVAYDSADVAGKWVQAVYQVDDSPRYWGVGEWVHADGVSTWTSGPTNRPLPRREFSKRKDYQVLGAINTHVVTDAGWVHYQSNHKLDKNAADDRVIALESGVNTYARTTEVDFSAAKEYWEKTDAYWAQVRAAWDEIYGAGNTLKLKSRWKGDPMYSHIFDLADLYWDTQDVAGARADVEKVIAAFLEPDAVALP